jgi:uncharacterized protein (TIGR02466 family)
MRPLTERDIAGLLSETVRHLNLGEAEKAEARLDLALAARPGLPQAQMLMGAVRLAQGRPAEGAEMLQRVLAASPGQPMVLFYLGNAKRALGDLAGARETYRGALKSRPDFPRAALALGEVLNQSAQPEDAEQVLAPLARQAAEDELAAEIENALGEAKMMQRHFDRALLHFERAIVLKPDLLAAEKNRATALEYLRQPERAAGAYRRVLAQDPLDIRSHLLLNELLHRSGPAEEFLRSYDLARQLRPHSPIPLTAKADQLLQLDRAAEAVPYYKSAMRLAPVHAAAHIGLGRALAALGESEAARVAFEAGRAACPGDVDLQIAHAAFVLGQGDAPAAQALTQQALAASPHSQPALAVLGLCYRAGGDEREAWLNGYDDLIQVYDLEPPDPYADLESFHRDLELDALHGEARQFFSQTLRGGSRSFEDFFRHRHALRDRLKRRIAGAVERYIAAMKQRPEHPFLGRRGRGFAFAGSWTSRMRDGGFHLNHIHNGWISSVYYVDVPEACEDTMARQGWLKFGEPSANLGFRNSIRRLVQPKPGRLVLFPSYLWHGTVPYHADQTRTTIAFDLNPI